MSESIERVVGELHAGQESILREIRELRAEVTSGHRDHEQRLRKQEELTGRHETHIAWVKWAGSSIAAALGGLHFFKH